MAHVCGSVDAFLCFPANAGKRAEREARGREVWMLPFIFHLLSILSLSNRPRGPPSSRSPCLPPHDPSLLCLHQFFCPILARWRDFCVDARLREGALVIISHQDVDARVRAEQATGGEHHQYDNKTRRPQLGRHHRSASAPAQQHSRHTSPV
ncbi:hypothetical protein B0J12DRAFT_667596 [Macrophomina phaseolina]|uniref:Uncharacterized protein n=1 Tax=Macrophomina phaseolina TaxID=35725 RepID=A0ABQ8G857_9PEZI|nr:hypothetical protein B0J12DRAFT_667596 [Macrophomina phaseolina]